MARQCLCRAAVAVGQIRAGLPAAPTAVSVKHALRSTGTCIFTIASGRIRALLPERRIVLKRRADPRLNPEISSLTCRNSVSVKAVAA
jgi:hypothetical protein